MPTEKGEAAFKKSPARRRSTSRGRTAKTPRSKSRSQSRSRKSPSRKSPARKSPARSSTAREMKPSPSPTRASRRRKAETVVAEPEENETVTVEETKKTTNHTHHYHHHELAPETPTRHSARLQAKHEEEVQGIHLPKPTMEEISLIGLHDRHYITKTKDLEMGGKLGALFLTLLLPLATIALNLVCSKTSCTVKKLPVIPRKLSTYFDLNTVLIFLGWIVFQVVLALLPVGQVVEGQMLLNGKRLSYRCNGFFSLVVSCLGFAGLVYLKKPVVYVVDHYIALMTTAIVFSMVLSIILYIKARYVRNTEHSPVGNSGNFIYDFFMGHELNPRIGNLDLKFFCELRPGLIGWVMLNCCFIAKDCMENKYPSYTLLLVSAFHLLYVADALWFEEAILTTMDITHDGFGFMLCFGDLAWVPFTYTLATKFLLVQPQSLPTWSLVAIGILNLIGYIIFRGSNSQKNEFRKNPYNPALSHLESIPTSSGKRLLVSGWWGLCRHPNYLGDLIMAFSWSLPCGFDHLLPWFYPIYLLILLVTRANRDDRMCHKKYNHSWDRYLETVPSKIFPKVF